MPGPFSFLAGLGLLGASAVVGAVEDAQTRERYKEFESHNYPPMGFQEDIARKLINRMEYAGYDIFKIQSKMWKEDRIDSKRSDYIIQATFAKHFTEQLGYEFRDDNAGLNHPGCARSFKSVFSDEFRHPLYDDIIECRCEDDFKKLAKEKGHNTNKYVEYLMETYNSIRNPWLQVERYQQMGYFQDIVIDKKWLWDPILDPEGYE